MSRSRKKVPCGSLKHDQFFKNLSNRRMRRAKHEDFPREHNNRIKYQFVCPWDICDYKEQIAKRQIQMQYQTKRQKIKKHCLTCKTEFYTIKNKYCSLQCAMLNRRKVERPVKTELVQLLRTSNYCAIGRKFGISDNAVRKWAKQYKIIPV
jgi:hypothetical protein